MLRLKRLVTDLSLDGQPDPQGSELKKVVSPVQKRMVIETVVVAGRCSVARASRLFGLARSALYRRGAPDPVKAAQEGMVAEASL